MKWMLSRRGALFLGLGSIAVTALSHDALAQDADPAIAAAQTQVAEKDATIAALQTQVARTTPTSAPTPTPAPATANASAQAASPICDAVAESAPIPIPNDVDVAPYLACSDGGRYLFMAQCAVRDSAPIAETTTIFCRVAIDAEMTTALHVFFSDFAVIGRDGATTKADAALSESLPITARLRQGKLTNGEPREGGIVFETRAPGPYVIEWKPLADDPPLRIVFDPLASVGELR